MIIGKYRFVINNTSFSNYIPVCGPGADLGFPRDDEGGEWSQKFSPPRDHDTIFVLGAF